VNAYTAFDLVVAGLAVGIASLEIRSARRLIAVAQTAAFVVLAGFPWDHFAITCGAWTYSDPGPRIFLVPINDLVFIFFASVLSATVLSSPRLFGPDTRQRQAKPEEGHEPGP
jgi:lycopene cyclase domain-containing protein